MRREYFTLSTRTPAGQSDDLARPTISIAFDGPEADLQAALQDDAGEPLPGEAIDVTCRLQGEGEDASCVLGLTHRLTGEFLLEVNADAVAVLDLVEDARTKANGDATYRIRIESEAADPFVYDKEALLVYDNDGDLLRGQSLIPSGVEL
jgi:hypothetical protein